ncbi:MAG: TIGR00282 family metallophosphoesterase [Planctomycetota bacterium]
MKFLLLGDVVGKPGYTAVLQNAKRLKKELSLDALIVNAENAADGSGLSPRQFQRLRDAGVDGVTMGDHLLKDKTLRTILESSNRIVKPANYPLATPGLSWMKLPTAAGPLAVISLVGRVMMKPVDCPFLGVDRILDQIEKEASEGPEIRHVLVDIHAEATSEKQAIARYLDGRVTAVLGTHTHVPTADARILPHGTAFQCDVGMTGPYESIIGRSIERILHTTLTMEPTHFHVATGDVRLCGAIVEANENGQATLITRFEDRISERVLLGA